MRSLAVGGAAQAGHEVLGPLDDQQARQLMSDWADTADASLFSTWPWFETLAKHGIEQGVSAQWYVVREVGGDAAFALPLLQRQRGQAAVYGSSLCSLSNYYSSLFSPVGPASACTVGACRALVALLKQGHGVLDLQPLDVSHPFFKNMQTALRAEGWLCDTYFCFGNWYLEVAGRSFSAYEPQVPSRIRNTVKRGRKKLNDTGPWEVDIVQAPGPGLERALDDWAAVYAKSWKVPEPFPDFVPALCRMAAEHGWLRLGILRLGPVPVAAQIWVLHQGRMLIYKLAYDEAHKHLSAGSVLTTELMRHALDVDRCIEVDYLTGDDAYKADWMSTRRERHGIVAFNPTTLQGLLSAGRHFAGTAKRRLVASRAARGTAPATAATLGTPRQAKES